MLYILIVILCSVLISALMHVSESRCEGKTWLLAFNYLLCAAFCNISLGINGQYLPLDQVRFPMILGFFASLVFFGGFMLMQWNTGRNGIVLSSMFMKLGVVVPVIGSILIYHEVPKAVHIAGIALALLSILLTREKGEKIQNFGMLLLLLVVEGLSNFSSKIQTANDPALGNHFLTMTFTCALVLAVVISLIRKERFTWREMLWGFAIGLPNVIQTRLMLKALETVDASIAYPIYSVGCILLTTLVGRFVFHEKITSRRFAAICVIMVSLVLLNI